MAKEFPENHPLLLEGINFFNGRDFFESHEAWEQIWLEFEGPKRNFYKGLILAAACFVHVKKNKIKPALIALQKAIHYLKPFQESGVAIVLLDDLLMELEICKNELKRGIWPKTYPHIKII